MNLLHVFNIYLWDNLKRYWNKFQFRKSLENAIAETCNAPSEIISHHYLWCPKPYKSNRWWLVLASQLRYTVRNSSYFHMLKVKTCLVRTAERSRAGIWEWCSLPLVPHLNPFAAYMKEILSLSAMSVMGCRVCQLILQKNTAYW